MSTTKSDSDNQGRKVPRRLWTFAFTYPGGTGYYGMLFHRRAGVVAAMKQSQLPEWKNRRLVSWTLDARPGAGRKRT